MSTANPVLSLLLSLHRQLDELRARVAELEAKQCHLQHALLTPMEVRVLVMLAQGYSNIQIGDRYHISEKTVRTHNYAILRKLELRNRTEAARYAWQHGIVSLGEAWETVMTMQYARVPLEKNERSCT